MPKTVEVADGKIYIDGVELSGAVNVRAYFGPEKETRVVLDMNVDTFINNGKQYAYKEAETCITETCFDVPFGGIKTGAFRVPERFAMDDEYKKQLDEAGKILSGKKRLTYI
jgi:hypothetical protein